MKQAATVALLGIMSVLPGLGQTNQADSQTLQDILSEVRGIHNDVRLSETTQILLTELEIQHGAVDKAMARRDDLHTKVSQAQANLTRMATQLEKMEDGSPTPLDNAQKAQQAQLLEQFKAQVPVLKQQEQDMSNQLLDAENALRKEQDTLSGIQDQLNDVVKKLQPANGR
jgi:chromosome segregation ATPase